ncbi:hypothetical protein GIB67_039818, partial [Kingdonia uniflora]
MRWAVSVICLMCTIMCQKTLIALQSSMLQDHQILATLRYSLGMKTLTDWIDFKP